MYHFPPQNDENTVVAFLSGIDMQRDQAALHLTHSYAARELLCMAQEALDAAKTPFAPPTVLPRDHRRAEI